MAAVHKAAAHMAAVHKAAVHMAAVHKAAVHMAAVHKAAVQKASGYLQATLYHPPAHKPLGAPHQEEESQPFGQGCIDVAPDCKVDGRASKHEAQSPAPHAMGILHPVYELELL